MGETPLQEYPKLLWSKDGAEVTAHSASEEAAFRKDGHRGAPPGQDEPKKAKQSTAVILEHKAASEPEPEPEPEPDAAEPAKRKR